MTGWTRVADWVRRARSDRKLTQAELAAKAGVSEPTIRVLETARRDSYNTATLRSVAAALGWTPDSIDRIHDGGEPVKAEDAYGVTVEEKLADLNRRLTVVERIIQEHAAPDMTPEEIAKRDELAAEGRRIVERELGQVNEQT